MPELPQLRRSAASSLRGLAELLEPTPLPARTPAPLIRLAGRWWHRDEVLTARSAGGPTEQPAEPEAAHRGPGVALPRRRAAGAP